MRDENSCAPAVLDWSVWVLVILDLLIVLGSVAYAQHTFHHLPARYPVHFDLHGVPNRWVCGDSKEWFLLPALAGLISLTMIGIGLSLSKMSLRYVNIPNKERFLALPPAAQAPILRSVVCMVLVSAGLLSLLLIGLQVALYSTALGTLAEPPVVAIFGGVGLILVVMIGWTVQLGRMVTRATKQQS